MFHSRFLAQPCLITRCPRRQTRGPSFLTSERRELIVARFLLRAAGGRWARTEGSFCGRYVTRSLGRLQAAVVRGTDGVKARRKSCAAPMRDVFERLRHSLLLNCALVVMDVNRISLTARSCHTENRHRSPVVIIIQFISTATPPSSSSAALFVLLDEDRRHHHFVTIYVLDKGPYHIRSTASTLRYFNPLFFASELFYLIPPPSFPPFSIAHPSLGVHVRCPHSMSGLILVGCLPRA